MTNHFYVVEARHAVYCMYYQMLVLSIVQHLAFILEFLFPWFPASSLTIQFE